MTVRSRVTSQVEPVRGSGTRYLFAEYHYDPGEIIGRKSTCDDVVDGTRDPHPLNIVHGYLQVSPLEGEVYVNEYSWRKYNAMRPGWATTCFASGCPELLPDLPSFNARAIRVINGSNPSRASVDLGVTLAELREAPGLVARAGYQRFREQASNPSIQQGGSDYLAWQFGWAPLIRDIVSCFQVVDHVNNRVRELDRLASNGGLRRKVQLDDDYRESDPRVVFLESSMGDVFLGELISTSRRRTWGTCNWVPSAPSPFRGGDPLMRARRAVYGAHADATTLWNTIPWSWMVDWFGNLGDFIKTTRNTVGAERSGPVCLMTETTHRDIYTRTSGPSTVTGGGGMVETVVKNRLVVPWVLPEFQMPFVSPGRLSILGSLAASRIPADTLPDLGEALDYFAARFRRH